MKRSDAQRLVALSGATPSPAALDTQALSRVARGEIGAIGEVYDRHYQAVHRFVARATAGAPDIDDLVHETFLTAAKAAVSFDGRDSCRPWLLGIAARVAQRRRRTAARYARALLGFAWLRGSDATHDPAGMLAARAELRDVQRAFAALSEPKRVVLLLADVEGLACEDIARALEVPLGTVWTRLHHARRELRARLSSLEAE